MKRFISLLGLRLLNEDEVKSIKSVKFLEEQNAIILLKGIAYDATRGNHYYDNIIKEFNRNISRQLEFYHKINRTTDTKNIRLNIYMGRGMYYHEPLIMKWAKVMKDLGFMTGYKNDFGKEDVNSYLFFRDEGAKEIYFEIEVDKIPDKSNLYYYTREDLVGARMFPQY